MRKGFRCAAAMSCWALAAAQAAGRLGHARRIVSVIAVSETAKTVSAVGYTNKVRKDTCENRYPKTVRYSGNTASSTD